MTLTEPAEPVASPPSRGARVAEWAPVVTFAVAIVVGFIALVTSLGRFFWFHGDEWQFLANREAGDLRGLIEPHNEHISLLPLLAWRAMFNLWGLNSYVPYQIPVIALHLTAVVLLWLVMRRSGVHPWIATAAASVFILFGPGEENIIWAFQIGFTGALVLGLTHLLLADHTGPIGRRDVVGLFCGLLGLLSAGFTPIITAVIFATVLVRRGLRPALFHSVPLAVIYASWWLLIGPDIISDPYGRSTDPGEIVGFVTTGFDATFRGIGGSTALAIAYAVLLPVGLLVAYLGRPRREALEAAVLPLSLFLAGALFLCLSGYGRWWVGPDVGASSRYIHLAAAFTLPALAVALDALARRRAPAIALVCLVLVSVIPHNIGQFGQGFFNEGYFNGRRDFVVSLAESPLAREVPPSTVPDPVWTPVPIGWLLDLADRGELPDISPAPNPAESLLFGLSQIDVARTDDDCETLRGSIDLHLERGDEIGVAVGPWTVPRDGWFFNQSFTIQLLVDDKPVGAAFLRHPGGGAVLRTELDALDVRIGLFGQTEALILCGA